MVDGAAALGARVGYSFHDEGLLHTALTHSSYLNESPDPTEDNQRLEYLGDAVLDFLIAEILFRQFPDAQEGDLTRWRAQLVSTEALAALALDLGMGEALLIGKGEEGTGGHLRPANLAAAFEAVVAAIYLDGGLPALSTVVAALFAEPIRRATLASGPADARSRLQELAQARYGSTPRYRAVDERGPDHARVFTMEVYIGDELYGAGEGRSKRAAAQAAADRALARVTATEPG